MAKDKDKSVYVQNVIDATYNGAKYPIVEREYNAYYFPDNYNPDNMSAQSNAISQCMDDKCKIKIYNNANPK